MGILMAVAFIALTCFLFITGKAVEETAAKWIPENCVIVAISGATAGRCAINKIKATTNQHCLNMQIDAEKALYKYVYYCMDCYKKIKMPYWDILEALHIKSIKIY